MKSKIKEEFSTLASIVKSLNKKAVIILLSVAVIQTFSWYVTSRTFFRNNFYYSFAPDNPNTELYEFIYWLAGDFFSFFVLASLIIKFIFKENLTDYGINIKNSGLGFTAVILSLIIMVPVIWFISAYPSFTEQYPIFQGARNNWQYFIIFQIFLLLFLFAWEFFWRGYMIFGLKGEFGYYAVLIQMIPFVILHNGKPFAETSGAIFGALALGILAYRTGSFIYGFLIHYGVMFSIEFISVLRFRAGSSGTGLDSLFQIVSKMF